MALFLDTGNNDLNTYSIQFIDSSGGGGKLNTDFIAVSDTYKKLIFME